MSPEVLSDKNRIVLLEQEIEELDVLIAEQTTLYNQKDAEMLKIRRVSYYLLIYQEERKILLKKEKQNLPLVDMDDD